MGEEEEVTVLGGQEGIDEDGSVGEKASGGEKEKGEQV